jgi:hypothetical protein
VPDEWFYDWQAATAQAAARRKGKPFREFQPRFNLLSAQINEIHVCTVEALKRDASLDIADVITAHAHAIAKLCELEFDAAAASAERAERLLVEAKRRKGSSGCRLH